MKPNNGEPLQTFVQFGNVILERVGGNFYLNATGETYALLESDIKELLYELDLFDINQPLTAAQYIAQNKNRFTKISTNL